MLFCSYVTKIKLSSSRHPEGVTRGRSAKQLTLRCERRRNETCCCETAEAVETTAKSELSRWLRKSCLTWIPVSSTGMTRMYVLLSILTLLPTLAHAETCTATPDCKSLGYTETSCPDGGGVKCPWNTSLMYCTPQCPSCPTCNSCCPSSKISCEDKGYFSSQNACSNSIKGSSSSGSSGGSSSGGWTSNCCQKISISGCSGEEVYCYINTCNLRS